MRVGRLLCRGISARTPIFMALMRGAWGFRGMRRKISPEILQKMWFPLDFALDENTVRSSAEVFMVDAIRHGTTTLIDHHASGTFIDGSLDVIADAVEKAGVRGGIML